MRISDWSSDVCSSDLVEAAFVPPGGADVGGEGGGSAQFVAFDLLTGIARDLGLEQADAAEQFQLRQRPPPRAAHGAVGDRRSEERRVGETCVKQCRYRWSLYHLNKNNTKRKYP